jgi:hypothetical protein
MLDDPSLDIHNRRFVYQQIDEWLTGHMGVWLNREKGG